MIDERYSTKLHYIEGTTMQVDLDRAALGEAKAIVILCDKFSQDAELEDTHTILTAMHIKNHLNFLKKSGKTVDDHLLCMQLLAPESITHYELSANPAETVNDQIVCIESLKLALLAKSCLCPGLVVLITNLIKSSGEIPDQVAQNASQPAFSWLNCYMTGK